MDYLTRGYADSMYCMINGDCKLNSLNVTNLTYIQVSSINATDIIGEHWWNDTGETGLTGTYSGDYNIDTTGNASFNGSFETVCMHCEDGDIYFHGDGFFQGNVTAPNIEVMESLIVHGNSTCTGTATACGDIGDSVLCGWTINTGQRGCRWRLFYGDCVGTALSCEEVGTAFCEEQHVCTLNVGSVGFTIGSLGLNGSFDINTTGDITANNYYYSNGLSINETGDNRYWNIDGETGLTGTYSGTGLDFSMDSGEINSSGVIRTTDDIVARWFNGSWNGSVNFQSSLVNSSNITCIGNQCYYNGTGDNLGNHIATQDLNMSGYNINFSGEIGRAHV